MSQEGLVLLHSVPLFLGGSVSVPRYLCQVEESRWRRDAADGRPQRCTSADGSDAAIPPVCMVTRPVRYGEHAWLRETQKCTVLFSSPGKAERLGLRDLRRRFGFVISPGKRERPRRSRSPGSSGSLISFRSQWRQSNGHDLEPWLARRIQLTYECESALIVEEGRVRLQCRWLRRVT